MRQTPGLPGTTWHTIPVATVVKGVRSSAHGERWHCGKSVRLPILQAVRGASPWAFTRHFPVRHFHIAWQWAVLTRTAAFASVHDRIAEPWFRTFGDRRPRCEPVQGQVALLDAAAALEAAGHKLDHSRLYTQLLDSGHLQPLPAGCALPPL